MSPAPAVSLSLTAMGIWPRLAALVEGGAEAMGSLIERIGAAFRGDPVRRRQVAFSVAMIALSAKMAVADGVVTRDEVAAFRRLYEVPEGEEANVTRLFNLARRDVAGFESYAARVAALYGAGDPILADILDGLFGIATADGIVHPTELAYLAAVATAFGLDDAAFATVKARHVDEGPDDPYRVLGVERALDLDAIRRVWRALAAENHPDRLIGRGVPPEFVAIAGKRMAAINAAWQRIEKERRPG